MVVCLDSPWGAGKSTFLQMTHLDIWEPEKKWETIWLDAFLGDLLQDPMLVIADGLKTAIDKRGEAQPKLKRACERLVELAKGTSTVLGHLGRAAALGAASAFGGPVAGEVASALISRKNDDGYSPDSGVVRAAELLQEFRDTLAKLVILLAEERHAGTDPCPRLVVVIDELDRCDPDTALATLSRVKHCFEVDGVVFVIAAHLQQLEEYVRGQFGTGVDARTFLQKLIHVRVALPPLARPESPSAVENYCGSRMEALSIPGTPGLVEETAQACISLNLGIREIDRLVSLMAVAYRMSTSRNSQWPLPGVNVALASLGLRNPELIRRIALNSISQSEIEQEFPSLFESTAPEAEHLRLALQCLSREGRDSLTDENRSRISVRLTGSLDGAVAHLARQYEVAIR